MHGLHIKGASIKGYRSFFFLNAPFRFSFQIKRIQQTRFRLVQWKKKTPQQRCYVPDILPRSFPETWSEHQKNRSQLPKAVQMIHMHYWVVSVGVFPANRYNPIRTTENWGKIRFGHNYKRNLMEVLQLSETEQFWIS